MTEDGLIRGGVKEFQTKYGTMTDVSIHMSELPELYRIHKEFNEGKAEEDKAEWVHITIKTSKAGKMYLAFNDYSLNPDNKKKAAAPKKVEAAKVVVEDDGDELPF